MIYRIVQIQDFYLASEKRKYPLGIRYLIYFLILFQTKFNNILKDAIYLNFEASNGNNFKIAGINSYKYFY